MPTNLCMVKISDFTRNELKSPLGKVYPDFAKIKELSINHRIISIGDICTLGILAIGIRPHLAVFDYSFMRQKLGNNEVNILKRSFENPKRYTNPAGTLSDVLLADAKNLLDTGGAVLIDGEEDLTAIAFILASSENDIIIYGQPNQGLVIVEPNKKIKDKIGKLLSS